MERQARRDLAPYRDRLQIDYLGERSVEELLRDAATLPPRTVVIYSLVLTDRTGARFVPRDVLQRLTKVANAPVFGLVSPYLDTGIVGGSVIDYRGAGGALGQALLALKRGEQPAPQPPSSFNRPMFDWRQLERWGLSPERLPADAVILNRPPTLWGQHRQLFLSLIAAFSALAGFSALQAVQNRRVRRAEAAALESARQLRAIFDNSPLAMELGELRSGRLVEVNDSWLIMFGFRREELSGRTEAELALYLGAGERQELVARLEAGENVVNHELRMRRQDGGVLDLQYSAALVALSGVPHLLVMLADITERKKSAAVAERMYLRQRAILDNLPMMAWLKDRDSRLELVNLSYAQACGLSVEECIGKTDLDLFPAELAQKYLADDREVCSTGLGKQLEEQIATPSGDRWAFTCKTPLFDEAGRVVGTAGVALDITEQRRVENQLRQALKMESVGRLAGGVAHDFNNQLAIILGYAELLRLEFPDWPLVQEQVEAIIQAARHSRDVTGQLLTFSRQQVVRPRPVDLNALIEVSLKLLPRLVGEDITLEWRLSPKLWRVSVDPVQVEQIIMNLAANARDAMPAGGAMAIETGNAQVAEAQLLDPFGARPGPYVLMSFSDTGCGMSSAVRSSIFGPFFTTKEPGKGTGLGLSTVYGIVVQNRGLIAVESEPGRGSSFRIYLPALEAEEAAAPPEAGSPVRGKATLLVVEDDPGVARLTATMLEVLGYSVLVAQNGDEALVLCRDRGQRIDLVLSDVVMPGRNGLEMMAEIARCRPGLKALFMSGYSAEVISAKGVPQGGDALLRKPFSMAELSEKVQRALRVN